MAQLLLTEMFSLGSAFNKYAIRHTRSFAHQFNYFDTCLKIDWSVDHLYNIDILTVINKKTALVCVRVISVLSLIHQQVNQPNRIYHASNSNSNSN